MGRSFRLFMLFVLGSGAVLLAIRHTYQSGEPQSEGYGINMGSRKYFEYLRNHDPATGIYDMRMQSAAREFATRLPRESSRSINWQSRGPFNKGGRTRALALDVLNESHLLAGSVSGGVWSSVDGGQSWNKTTAAHQMHSVSCLVQDTRPGHENVWYQGTGEESYGIVSGTSFISLYSGDGMMKSVDNGNTWTPLASTTSGTPQNVLQLGSYDFIWNIALDHTNQQEDIVYAAVYSGIIRSTDGGESWQQVLGFGNVGQEYADIIISPAGVLYASLSYANPSNKGGYFRSEDGINWTNITPAQITNQRRTVMCVNPQNENEVYFLTEIIGTPLSTVGHTLFKYTYLNGDGSGSGGIWQDRSSNLPDDPCNLFIGVNFDFGTWRSQFSFDLCMTHHPTEPDVLFIGGINIHRSNTAFAQDDHTWIGGYRCNEANPIDYSYTNHHSDQHLMVFSRNNPQVMYSANDGGVYRTDNALAQVVQWTPLNSGYLTTQFYTVGMEQGWASSDFVFGGMQDNGTWITNSSVASQPWKEVHADDGSYCALPQGRSFMITSSQSGRIYKKTIDANGQLTGTRRIDPEQGPAALFINPLLLDPFNHNDLFIAGNRTIWWLPNVSNVEVNGDYYSKLPQGQWINMTASLIPASHGSISCLDKAITDNSVIYYGTTVGKVWKVTESYSSEPIRTQITGTEFPSGAYTSCITANDFDVDEVMVSFANYGVRSIFHSTDGGANWQDVSGNLEQNQDGSGTGPAVYWVEIYPGTPKKYFAGTSAGLFSTELLNGTGTIWQMEGAETIGNVVINMVKVRPYDGKIAVATHANGIYTGQLDAIPAASVYQHEGVLNNAFKAYPVPFNSQLTFEINTMVAGDAAVLIYDIYGKQIDAINWQLPARGVHKKAWTPGPNVPSGTYLYRCKIGEATYSGKFIYN